MSELGNDHQQRQRTLQEIIRDLHAGVSVEEIKARFGRLLDQVGAVEIGQLEQSLIDEGLAVEEIQKLCDIHLAIFKDSLDKQGAEKSDAGDPVLSFQKENEKISKLVRKIKETVEGITKKEPGSDLKELLTKWHFDHQQLLEIEQHYSRKENILFPYLERHGISGPPSVMWGIHDEIRASLKEVSQLLSNQEGQKATSQFFQKIDQLVRPVLEGISEMIYKEEKILYPMCKDTLSLADWNEIGILLQNPETFGPQGNYKEQANVAIGIDLSVGSLTPEQVNLIFTHLPVDITFVDENDQVRFFSAGPGRVFERTAAIIGRKVQNCHPPASMGIVNQILDQFKSDRENSVDFWLEIKGDLIYIRYFAVRDKKGHYRGALEVTQNITEIQSIKGEKRIYDQKFTN